MNMARSILCRGVGVLQLSRKAALLSGARFYSRSEAEPLTVSHQTSGIRRIILNNPKKRNALSLSMLESLRENILADVDSDDLRVIIISAKGPVFSSGHDLKELTSAQGQEYHTKVFHTCSEVMTLIQDIPVPVIAMVNGVATAAGCQLVASCDIAVVTEKSTFATPGVNVGLFCSTPAVAIGRAVPRKVAMEMLFTGTPISAHDALLHGLVSKVVPEERLEEETLAIAQRVCQTSRPVVALGKATFQRQMAQGRDAAYATASKVMVDNLALRDGQEGIHAFIEKRKPWRPGSTGQILSDLDLTSQKEGRWKRLNTLAHYNVRDNATLVLSRVLHTQSFHQHQDSHEEKNALLEDDNTFHLVRQTDEIDEVKSKRGSMKDKAMTKAITEIYLTRLLSVKGTLQQFVDNFFRSVLCSGSVVPPAVKYFFDFLDEQAQRHDNVDEETLHIWKTNSLPMRFWVNILRNPHFIFDVHVTEVVDASLHVIAQTFMDACTKTEHKLSRESPSNKLLYAKEISTYKKMVDDYYRGIRQMVPVSDQDMNTHLAEVSRQHTDKLNTQVALHQLYQFASKYYDVIIQSLDEDPAAQNKQLTLRLQQVAAALENKVTDL